MRIIVYNLQYLMLNDAQLFSDRLLVYQVMILHVR
jgi:hypothetical protein